jgi:hypothetical protein
MWWFDSSGLPPAAPATGAWVDATLTLEGPGRGGASRCTFTVEGERLRVRIEHAADGSTVLEGTYSRA